MIDYFDKTVNLDKLVFAYQRDINDYFTNKNLDSYLLNQKGISDIHIKALKLLFDEDNNSDLTERCNKAIDLYPLCFEAYYIAFYLYDSLSFYYFSLDVINHSFSDYQSQNDLMNLSNIYILLATFFIDIKNNHKAIEMLDEASFFVSKEEILTKYLIAYSFLEDSDKMMELYNTVPFIKPKDYILLILCLLKTNNVQEAKDVYNQMLDSVKYADLLCYPNKIEDINDEDALNLLNDIDSCFELIESVPYFFSFLSDCVKEHNRIIN